VVNAWVMWAARLENLVVLPAVSPYDNPAAGAALAEFRRMLERRVDFGGFRVEDDPARPMLLVGAVDVRSGEFKAFNSRRDRVTADMILASAAIPPCSGPSGSGTAPTGTACSPRTHPSGSWSTPARTRSG
jgi:NTE family protein